MDFNDASTFDEDKTKYYNNLLQSENIHLNKIYFFKDGMEFPVTELSSGERLFALIILSMCFAISDDSLVLFDEPENSMHPKWQEKVAKTICDIFHKFSKRSTLIIATHSPLVVSSVPNDKCLIANMPVQQDWNSSKYNGNNSDSILKEQFGLLSARSTDFIIAFQECLNELGSDNKTNFNEKFNKLCEMKVSLNVDDPLYEAFETMKSYYEG